MSLDTLNDCLQKLTYAGIWEKYLKNYVLQWKNEFQMFKILTLRNSKTKALSKYGYLTFSAFPT